MKLRKIFNVLEKVAPVSLSDEFCQKYKMYDNSGIIIDSGKNVVGVLFALDLTLPAVEEAKSKGYNLIVTHHPAVYGGISRFNLTEDPLAQAIAECMKCGVSVISMHLNFDAAPEGIDYWLMRGLGGNKAEIAAKLDNGGYGRVYEVEKDTLSCYVEKIKKEFNSQRVVVYGDKDKSVNKVASFCGAGCDDENMAFAVKNGADVFVSADLKHHEILALTGRGMAVVQLTHYASENYGLIKIYEQIKDRLEVKSAYYTDENLL